MQTAKPQLCCEGKRTGFVMATDWRFGQMLRAVGAVAGYCPKPLCIYALLCVPNGPPYFQTLTPSIMPLLNTVEYYRCMLEED